MSDAKLKFRHMVYCSDCHVKMTPDEFEKHKCPGITTDAKPYTPEEKGFRSDHPGQEETMIICGIDPGMSGGIAKFTERGLEVFYMPTVEIGGSKKRRRKINAGNLALLLTGVDHVFVEKAQSMPGQGVASMFGYGEAYGTIKGICAAKNISLTEVHPKTWKKVMLYDCNRSSKDAARYRAMQLWPGRGLFDRKKDEHVAEAALIAEYGRRQLTGAVPEEE